MDNDKTNNCAGRIWRHSHTACNGLRKRRACRVVLLRALGRSLGPTGGGVDDSPEPVVGRSAANLQVDVDRGRGIVPLVCPLCSGTGFHRIWGKVKRYRPCRVCGMEGSFYAEHPRHREVLDRIIEAVYANEER